VSLPSGGVVRGGDEKSGGIVDGVVKSRVFGVGGALRVAHHGCAPD